MSYRALTRMTGALLDPLARLGGATWRARFGHLPPALSASVPPRDGIWLHAASVGEITSALPLAQTLARRLPVVVTCNTPTGRDMAMAAGLPALLAPVDLPQALERFIAALAPRLALSIEGELWPNRSAALAARGIPQVLIGARLSERSAARWARLRGTIGPVLSRLSAVSAQDPESEARLVALGLPQTTLLPRVNLKLLAALARPVLPQPPTRAETLLAASTHEGEEEAILSAVAQLRTRSLPLRFILAPRHPQRFEAVARLMTAQGLTPARRSEGHGEEAPLLLADSMGEMDRWYAASGVVLTGGSLVAKGGHTPWEPAAQGCMLLHGPHVENFSADYAKLDAAGAAIPIDAASLGDTVARLMADPQDSIARGARARTLLEAEAGDAEPLLEAIETLAGLEAR